MCPPVVRTGNPCGGLARGVNDAAMSTGSSPVKTFSLLSGDGCLVLACFLLVHDALTTPFAGEGEQQLKSTNIVGEKAKSQRYRGQQSGIFV